jgi:NAD(P)-dependent dehydrogenase (short-subunit alcohol dehydrogenase family)
MRCEDRVAIVTGAAGRGMGRSIALTLAREGACVVVNYRTSAESAAAIVRHVEARGGQALAVQADITRQEACRALVETAVETFGRVDICIVGPGGGWHPESVDRIDPAGALDDVQRELAPLYNLMPLVLPGMYERGWGRLIGIAQHPHKRSPAYAYNAGKAARSSALLLAEDAAWAHGVTVNVICPGPVAELPSLEAAVDLCDHGPSWAARANVTPQDIAEGAAMLCSKEGRFITGCQLPYSFA